MTARGPWSYDPRMSPAWRRLRARVLAGKPPCWLCGFAGADTLDHVVPYSIAPERALDPSNVRPAHKWCNSSRGNGTHRQVKQGPAEAPEPTSRDW